MAQREKRMYLFNSQEYQVTRIKMIKECSRIIAQHTNTFMKRVIASEDVREVSLLFKEKHFGTEKF
jgi:hypothetical protein